MKIALLTCSSLPELLPSDQRLIPALAEYDIIAQPEIWDDQTVEWSNYDYLLFRNTWDYFEKEAHFNSWLDQLENSGCKTLNSIDVIRKNKHKFYLRELEANGIKILPTYFIEKTNDLNLSVLIPSHWERAVIKPAFSGGSYLTTAFYITDVRTINDQYKAVASEKELLLQEFRPEIHSHGETSFIFFSKKFSHCVNKRPKEGEFRVQFQFGGEYQLTEPKAELVSQAQKVVDTFAEELLYARVDGIIINDELHLMEVECIEPDLYLNLEKDAHQKFAMEIAALVGQKTHS